MEGAAPTFLVGYDRARNKAKGILAGCQWPDCGHDTNQSDNTPGCRGAFCDQTRRSATVTQGWQKELTWTEKEQTAISKLMEDKELSYPAVIRLAVRYYQADEIKRQNGETVTWSGDRKRMEDFAGPLMLLKEETPGDLAQRVLIRLYEAGLPAVHELVTLRGECKFNYVSQFQTSEQLRDYSLAWGDAMVVVRRLLEKP